MIRIRWYAPLFVFYWMISLHANAQENSSAATLIRDIYSNWFNDRPFAYQECDTFFYSDKVDTAIMNKVKANFLSDKEFKEWDPDQAAYVKRKTRFTLEERRYIVAQLDLIKNMKWPAKMFPFAYMIPLEKVDPLLTKTDQSKLKPQQKICMEVHHFSSPIFLRNNTLCFFYLGKSTIFSKEGAFWIYEKIEGEWKRLASIYEWSVANTGKYNKEIDFFNIP
ncbi:MAG: hypothetical protein HYI21_03855 [Sediminibacterium sp. Gen4]|jgi:hypothetical protein|uniref:hypothetical protein n=1 Tax=unclassified Sediminibacterium TaxID=2635961 RepID=UPI0015BF8A23|nr:MULTISPECIES: hypothetical protein [unclassified Sediminibacterium]MBW0161790.1 hypothetical protein [Sediminibacterium sp.]MBW0165351.1 hypothetical protein [Sediminibacterium sp.]NWK65140.1 hypothetical protein [Sediminibacterium sp. Gen4]